MDYFLSKKKPLLGISALHTWLRIPILAGVLPRINCPILRFLLLNIRPHFPLFLLIQAILYIQMTLTCPNILLSGIVKEYISQLQENIPKYRKRFLSGQERFPYKQGHKYSSAIQ
jgi:hypothetical protein